MKSTFCGLYVQNMIYVGHYSQESCSILMSVLLEMQDCCLHLGPGASGSVQNVSSFELGGQEMSK